MLPLVSALFGRAFSRGPRTHRQVALTFDDGPSEETPAFLDLLDAFAARATFFQCGQNVERLPAISRVVRDRGHEIGNHTWSHPRLPFCAPARIREEIGRAQEALARAAGVRPRLFRPPYGLPGLGLPRALRQHGLVSVMWTVMGYDWEWEASEIAAHVLSHVSNGAIVCLHDGNRVSPQVDRRNTLEALRAILPKLRDRGFTFVTAGEMIA